MSVSKGTAQRIAERLGYRADEVLSILQELSKNPYPLGTVVRWYSSAFEPVGSRAGNMAILGPDGWCLIPNTTFTTEPRRDPGWNGETSNVVGWRVVYNPDTFDVDNAEVVE